MCVREEAAASGTAEMLNICVNLSRVGPQMVQRQPNFGLLLILCNGGRLRGGEVVDAHQINYTVN